MERERSNISSRHSAAINYEIFHRFEVITTAIIFTECSMSCP